MVFTSTTARKPENLIFFFKIVRNSNFDFCQSWNHLSFVNISPTLVIDTSMERSSRVLHHGDPKIWFFFFQKSSKFEFWLLTKSWNHLSFVNISPTLVIDTSMERSSRVLHHGNPRNVKIFSKSSKLTKLNSVRTSSFRMPRKKSPWLYHYQSYISNWYVNGKVFTSTTTWEAKYSIFFFQKSSKLNSTCILTCAEELKSFK